MDITNTLNSLTYDAKIIELRCPVSSSRDPASGPGCGSLVLDVFSCISLSLSLYLWAGCDLALSPFTNVSGSCGGLFFVYSCLKSTLRFFVARSPTPNAVSSETSLLTTLGLESESFVPNWSYESSLTLFITRKLLSCVPVIFNFLGDILSNIQTSLIQHQMLSHVLWCDFVQKNCLSNSFTPRSPVLVACTSAVLFHCRRLMRGSGDVKVGSSNWFMRFVAFRAVRARIGACHA